MKHIRILFFSFFVLTNFFYALNGFAQAKSDTQFSAGVAGGLNLTDISFSGLGSGLSTSPLLRINLGIWGKYELMENISAHVGFLYSGQGASIDIGTSSGKVTAAVLQIPVYGAYKFYDENNIKISGLLGAYAGFQLTSNIDVAGYNSNNVRAGLDLGPSLGVEVEMVENVSFMLTYNYGLLKALDFDGIQGASRFFQLTAVYYFFKM